MVVEVERGRAVFCDKLSGGSEEGIVGWEKFSKEGCTDARVDTVDGRLLP